MCIFRKINRINRGSALDNMKNPKRALMLASVASMIDQFNMDNIQILQELGYEVDVVADFVDGGTITSSRLEDLKSRLQKMNVNFYHVSIPRAVTNIKGIVSSYIYVKRLCEHKQYEMIHCHSPIGGVIARLAAKTSRRKGTKVIYTAHGFHFYEGAPKKNWLLFYPIEKYCSRFTDVLITINKEDYKRAKEKFHAKKIVYVPGIGVDTQKFKLGLVDVEKKRVEIGIQENEIMLFSVGELSERKNHEVVIRALYNMKVRNVKYYIAGKGPLEAKLKKMVHDFGISNQVFFLGYRTDISALCQAADMFVFPSYQEGLPVALMEAMASSLPCVVGKIRGNTDLIEDGEGGFLVEPENVEQWVSKLQQMYNDTCLREKMGRLNCEKIRMFDINIVRNLMRDIYKLL